ncbi:MAG TPA: pirin family protein, partial [Nitrososphaera sp.]|nr:pirin family protein [Nitrososphaera sp.]
MPEKEFLRTGGRLHGFQLWINLPRKDKMISPRYQDISSEKIPVGQSEDGLAKVRVITGKSLGKEAVIETRTPISILHFTLKPGGQILQAVTRE